MTPRIPRWQRLLFVVHVACMSVVTSSFNCRRPSITCAHSGTCGADGLCTSCGEYEGYNCVFPSTYKNENDCSGSTTCLNEATCYDSTTNGDTTQVECLCQPQHMGDTCDVDRYTVTCTNTKMDVSISPYSLSQSVYEKDKKGTCDLTEASGTWTKSGIQHASDSSCGDASESTNPDSWTRKFVVQDLSDKVTDADFVVTAVCYIDNAQGTATTATLDVLPYVGTTTKQSEVGDVSLTSIDPTGTTRNLGDVVTFTFTGNSDLEEIRLETVTADDNQPSGSSDTLIASGCRVTGKSALVETNPAHPSTDNKVVEVKLRIFQFTSNPSLKYTFTFKACIAGDTSNCNPVSCTSRRKRAVSSSSTFKYSSRIEVTFFSEEDFKRFKESSGGSQCTDADCQNIILPVVTSGAALFLGVVAVGLLLVLIKRWRNQRKLKDSKTKQGPV